MGRTAKGLQFNRQPKTPEQIPLFQAKRRALDKIYARAGFGSYGNAHAALDDRVIVLVEQGMDELAAVDSVIKETVKRALSGMERRR